MKNSLQLCKMSCSLVFRNGKAQQFTEKVFVWVEP